MIKRDHDLLEVQSKVSIDTMMKEIEAMRKTKDDDILSLQQALANHMDGTSDSANQIDQLRMDIAEAHGKIESMVMSERELRKSLDIAINERKNEEFLKNETISSYEIELTVRMATGIFIEMIVYCLISLSLFVSYSFHETEIEK